MVDSQDAIKIENKKRSLRRYKNTLACIARLEERYISIDRKIMAIRSPNISGMPRGGVPVTVDELISDKMDLEARIERLKIKARALKNEILSEIDSLEDDRYCELLESHFIDCTPLELVAEKMGYTERHIYTLYSEAISALIEISV